MDLTLFHLAILGVVIGANNLAVSIALGSLGERVRRARILFVFAVFEFTVPLMGVALGRGMSEAVSDAAHWIAPLLLAGLAAATLHAALETQHDRARLAERVTTWRGLAMLSAGLSLDNLVAGFSLGLAGIPPFLLAITVMCFSVAFAWAGLTLGARARRHHETAAEILSGTLLLILALGVWRGWL